MYAAFEKTNTEHTSTNVLFFCVFQITNVNPRFCKCLILNVGKVALREPFRGQLR